MKNLTLSEKYGIVAVLALFIVVLIDNPIVMLVIATLGLGGGMFVVQQGEAKRVTYVAAIAFALILGFGLFRILQ